MNIRASEATHTVGDKSFAIWVLEKGDQRAEVYPGLGFNCFRWTSGGRELLFNDDSLFATGKPTRAGIPILFPFPNRIRNAQFDWKGQTYKLPVTDSSGPNAIHGFACRNPWRVIESGTTGQEAWVTGEFWARVDAPETLNLWPADHRIRVKISLGAGLKFDIAIDNPDRYPLPFGLGFHPYFRLSALAPPEGPEAVPVQAPASAYWELQDNLPTGNRRPVDARRDLNKPRPIRELTLDDVLTGLRPSPDPDPDGKVVLGRVGTLTMKGSPSFRELVVFTPPHRQAFCLEPYTCTTDAINLHARGIDAGLQVLGLAEKWTGTLEFSLS